MSAFHAPRTNRATSRPRSLADRDPPHAACTDNRPHARPASLCQVVRLEDDLRRVSIERARRCCEALHGTARHLGQQHRRSTSGSVDDLPAALPGPRPRRSRRAARPSEAARRLPEAGPPTSGVAPAVLSTATQAPVVPCASQACTRSWEPALLTRSWPKVAGPSPSLRSGIRVV